MPRSVPLRASLAQAIFGIAATCLFVAAAQAHDARAPISADAVSIQTDGGPAAAAFSFSASAQEALVVDDHDFTKQATGLLVRGVGANGGSTGRIALDSDSWSPVLDGEAIVGFTYDDATGAAGGIQTIMYDRVLGSLAITGGGSNWPWSPAGAQSEVWVHFNVEEEWFCAKFADDTGATVSTNAAGHYAASGAAALAACPTQICGNGVHEIGEGCDDGNLDEGDSCSTACEEQACDSVEYTTTFDAIQAVVFEQYGCTFGVCHGSAASGGLDLRDGSSYDSLVGVPAQQGVASLEGIIRVVAGEPSASFLFQKLEGAVNPEGWNAEKYQGTMPVGGALIPEHLEALRRWIRGGAPRDLVVEETAELLGACLPPTDPLKIAAPPHPGAGVGVQLRQTAYHLPANRERELCMATYYDFAATDLIPEEFQVDCEWGGPNNYTGKCFLYHETLLLQDPQSHHSIIHIALGDSAPDFVNESNPNRQYGPWTYKHDDLDDPDHGEACDPYDIDPALGYNPNCSGADRNNIACLGYGPPEFSTGQNAPTFGGSQEPYADTVYAPGVFATLPMTGVVVWNSHAFNLTDKDTTMAQYLNMELAKEEDRLYPARGIFDARYIFDMRIDPFQTQELCGSFTLPNDARLNTLSSHTHRFGSHFRIWEPPNVECRPFGGGGFPACEPGPPERLIYSSRDYSDPAVRRYSPPLLHDETNSDDRTYLYCSLYDNGSTPESPPVKRASQINGGSAQLGRCDSNELFCLDGPHQGMPCGILDDGIRGSGDDSLCDSFEGADDGQCDACTVQGFVTTEDEMFILLGSFHIQAAPEPGGAALAAAALAALGVMARRRRE